MAVLEKIRRRGGMIIFFIGLGLLLFILPTDWVPKMNNVTYVVKINGKKLSPQQFDRKIEEITRQYRQGTRQSSLDERTTDMLREQAWQQLLSEEITGQEYQKIGLTVSPEELFDMVQGPNPSPTIRQIPAFANPQTGEFDRSALINFLKNKNSNPDAAQEWSMLEEAMLQDRYAQKYHTLISKGIFIPSFVAANENTEINKKVDFDYLIRQYASVADSTIKITANDLKKYYRENKRQWEQTPSRDIEYVVFGIAPSEEDRAAADKWIEKIKPEFEQAENAQQFVNLNSHVPFDGKFYTKEQLPVQTAELFDAGEGTMTGPYQEGEALKLARLVKIDNRPDSIKVRQIVVVPRQQTQAAAQQVVALADSIKTAIDNGADFTTLALKYSADPSVSANNGDIGWVYESGMAAGSIAEQWFDLKKGETLKQETSQGIYIIQVTERGKEVKKVQIATLQYNITPSPRTEQILYTQASKFAMENRTEERFNETAAAQNLNKRVASYLGENDRQIPGLSSARQIVRWAYEADKGDVSDVFTLSDAYVIAILKEIRKEGIAPLQQVVNEVNTAVRKQKKAEQIIAVLAEEAKNASSFGDLALKLGLPVETASAVTFSSFSVPGVGIEPQLIAAATSLDEGNISQPVEGSNGVFLLTVKQISGEAADSTALEEAKSRLSSVSANRVMSESMQALHKAATIKDMRSRFY
ncbi:MAG: SurA N-terminal domain-containing protein [Bacteroidales bacterium]|jgi:peptidyl-prolyl cis-trans isomerase D|nr:SurA N-terminal domain-containing protein [Bacteroidales bacterium]